MSTSVLFRASFLAILLVSAGMFAPLQGSTRRLLPDFVSNSSSEGAVHVADSNGAASLVVSPADFAGVRRAASDLQTDLETVTDHKPDLRSSLPPSATDVVIIGTIGHSSLIDALVAMDQLDVAPIRGRWEAFLVQVVANPSPGVARALVIAGSDQRGTIYGIYELSRQIGVSPWAWWADVPVVKRQTLSVAPVRLVESGPAVKYRGIFLNDEAPALTNWAKEKFGGFNHGFYAKVFDLILRLRANYLWPAMWGSAFADDDPANAPLANDYGIVMGTSHHEPLMRAHDEWRRYGKGPWDYAKNDGQLRQFWRGGVERVRDFEQIISLGMRGDGDEPMSEEANVALLERIVADQRQILTELTGKPPAAIPQLWALYKEVQGYYERGMRVPDDVTLLWCDDNWGNLRRLPTAAERKRTGGAGIYYHFDYVGGPRNYKWLNTVPLPKIWEQMNLAWKYDANQIWIVNVGDLKPLEYPIDFFLTLAWDPARLPADKIPTFSREWAAEQFGEAHATAIASLVDGYSKLNGRRKPEMLAPETYSLLNYHEAERVEAEWSQLVTVSQAIESQLLPEQRDAYFQLVAYPVRASANLNALYVAAGRNRLYAAQGRADTTAQAQLVRQHFAHDRALAQNYHTLGRGKWNHQMDQIKFGYTTWQQPEIETMPAVREVMPRTMASLGLAVEGSEIAWPSYGAPPATLPALDSLRPDGSRWLDVFNRGATPFDFRVSVDVPGITVSLSAGTVQDRSVRVEVRADWAAVPSTATNATLTVDGGAAGRIDVRLPLIRRPSPPQDFKGTVAADGYFAIDAPHFSRTVAAAGIEWQVLENLGRTVGAITSFPVDAADAVPDGASSRVEYDVYLPTSGKVVMELFCAPSLDFQPGEKLRIGISWDNDPVTVLNLDTWQTLQTWEKAVGDGVRRISSAHELPSSGRHTLKLWYLTPGVVVQRITGDLGGLKPSYLGPPESPHFPGR